MRKCRKCGKKYPKEVLVCPECGQDLKYPEGKKFAIITLILMVASMAIGLIGNILSDILLYNSIENPPVFLPALSFPISIAGFVLAMIGHAKYPGNVFCTVLFWISIGEAISFIILLILVIVICGMLINSCQECGQLGLILLR